MFDFTPVGIIGAVVGVLFVSVFGWRLIPLASRKQKTTQDLFDIEDSVTEIAIPEDAPIIGQSLLELEAATEESDAVIVGLIRGRRSIFRLTLRERIQTGGVLLIKAGSEGINKFTTTLGLELPGKPIEKEKGEAKQDQLEDLNKGKSERLRSEDLTLIEVIAPSRRSRLTGHTSSSPHLRVILVLIF